MSLQQFKIDELAVECYDTREQLGAAAGEQVIDKILDLLERQEEVNIIFGAAPSQLEFLKTLCATDKVDWQRINAFHMDEYIGLEEHAPQGFGNFLHRHLFAHLSFRAVYYLDGSGKDPETVCKAYASLLKRYPTDIVCMGIGENGHIAFNDPHVADFNDPLLAKVVELDDMCRQQQVNDKCFDTFDEVPKHALTLTVPALMSARYAFCMVPGPTKAKAVRSTLFDAVTPSCPATILREHPRAKLFIDRDSFSLCDVNHPER